MAKDIKEKTIKNFIWILAERFGAQGVTFVVSIVLARLLDPAVYGTVALVTIFTAIMTVFVESGLGTALVQKVDSDDLDFSTVFFFNVAMCLTLYAGMFFAAPLIAGFYKDESLVPIIRVLSLVVVVSGLRNIQKSYVARHMIFKKYFYSTIGSTIASAVVGIGMAYAGMGVWALVGQQLCSAIVGTIVLWFTVKWRPKLMFSISRLKRLFSFGWKLLASSLLDTVYNDLRQLIIGTKYSAEDLAYYNKGGQIPKLVVVNLNASIDSILLPTMAQAQKDVACVKQMTRRAICVSTYIMAPMMIGLAVCAEPLVRLLLTDKWLPCVFFLQIYAISYLFYPIHTANLNAIKAMGRSDYFLKLEIVKKIVGVSLILTTMWISVRAMACSLLIATLASTVINAFPNKRLLNYSWFEQMKDILPSILLAVVMGIPVYLIGFLPLPTIAVLAIQVAAGAVIYIGLSVILRLEIFVYLLNAAKGFLKKRKA